MAEPEVVPAAATYTLGLNFSRRAVKAWGNKENKTHIQLTICFPSQQFATQLERHLRRVQDDKENDVFSASTVTLKECKVIIILPNSVKEIETDAKGIILVFEKQAEATAWQQYSKIWSPRGQTKLRISYDWTHPKLSEAVGYPPK